MDGCVVIDLLDVEFGRENGGIRTWCFQFTLLNILTVNCPNRGSCGPTFRAYDKCMDLDTTHVFPGGPSLDLLADIGVDSY